MLATLLAVAAVCGPAGATTLAQSQSARVFSRAGQVRGCTRSRRGSWRLGDADRVLEARVAGRYALLRRRGESLAVYDVARRRRETAVQPIVGPPATFVRTIFDRSGSAAYLARNTDTGEYEVGSTGTGILARGFDIDPRVLRYAGWVIAYRRTSGYELAGTDELSPAGDGTLARRGRMRLGVRGRELWARIGPGGRRLGLGSAIGSCTSPSGCNGVDGVRLQPRFAAARINLYDYGSSVGWVTVGDPRARERHTTCRAYAVRSYVLFADGAVACAVIQRAGPGEAYDARRQVLGEGAVLDEGPGIALDSLRRRGDELVWRHDGAERTAPLPRRG